MSENKSPARKKDALEGKTLAVILETLVKELGWPALAHDVPIRCFLFEPTLNSSLKFLRRTPWARAKVEEIYRALVENDGTINFGEGSATGYRKKNNPH